MNQLGSSKSVTVRNSHQLHYQLRGNGPHAILCIPGALGTALTDFLPQLEYFGHEGSGFTVVGMARTLLAMGHLDLQNMTLLSSQITSSKSTHCHVDGYALMKALSFKKFLVLGLE